VRTMNTMGPSWPARRRCPHRLRQALPGLLLGAALLVWPRIAAADMPIGEAPGRHFCLRGLAHEGQRNALAVIEDRRTGMQKSCRSGDRFGDAVVTQIGQRSVSLRWKGRESVLKLGAGCSRDADDPACPTSGSRPAASCPVDPDLLLMAHDLEPHVWPDGRGGLVITGITTDSLPYRLGLRDGDIICAINGTPITRPHVLAAVYSGMQHLPAGGHALAGGIVRAAAASPLADAPVLREIGRVRQKIERQEPIPLRFVREGKERTLDLAIGGGKSQGFSAFLPGDGR